MWKSGGEAALEKYQEKMAASWWKQPPKPEPQLWNTYRSQPWRQKHPTLHKLEHGALDVVGIFDPTPLADGTNAMIYFAHGEHKDAAISGAAAAAGFAFYLVSDAVKLARVSTKLDDTLGVLKFAGKSADDIPGIGKAAAKSIDESIDIVKVNVRFPRNYKYAGKTHPSGVKFTKQGFPDFSPYAEYSQKINNLTGIYEADAKLANMAVGFTMTPDGYLWHHVEDGMTMMLVPKEIHKAAQHTGGAAVLRSMKP